ncbi:hypothetical protein [Clostridium sp.]|uniref:hypothetical protein n=1 Tax=Clostridium sp. TaxID=1506 RepID=UPI0028447406|nr:hypothetical protein [Clostridium sp.]MDR3593924.1 hypothetical protein [Clostridium sp.]
MIIFHKARNQIGLIAGLLGQSADVALWKIGALEKSSYALMKRAAMLQYGTFLHIRTFLADGLVIFLIVPKFLIL